MSMTRSIPQLTEAAAQQNGRRIDYETPYRPFHGGRSPARSSIHRLLSLAINIGRCRWKEFVGS